MFPQGAPTLRYPSRRTSACLDPSTSTPTHPSTRRWPPVQALMEAAILASTPAMAASLRRVLHGLHSQKHQPGVDRMLLELYEPILFRRLSAANPDVRRNALNLLVDAFPLRVGGGHAGRAVGCWSVGMGGGGGDAEPGRVGSQACLGKGGKARQPKAVQCLQQRPGLVVHRSQPATASPHCCCCAPAAARRTLTSPTPTPTSG